MIVFQNKGAIDIRAIKTFGVNSKDNQDSAIGYFGTGLKYAIAILLRAGATVSILTGGQMYRFSCKRTKIRHDEFDIVYMDDTELGFTTDLGKEWEIWMAFREIYSNMLDEGGEATAVTFLPDPDPEQTYVIVDRCVEFEKCYKDKHLYFIDKDHYDPVHVDKDVDFLEKEPGRSKGHIFFKGVRVMQTRVDALYDYQYHTGLTLTEDRTVKDGWDTAYHLAGAITRLRDKVLIKKFIMADPNNHEALINLTYNSSGVTEEFLDTVQECRTRYKDIGVNLSAIKLLKSKRVANDPLPKHSIPLNTIHQAQLDKAITFCKDILELDLDSFKLIVCKDLGKQGLYGRADMDQGIMYISKLCFDEGTKRVATALLEEYTHCAHEVEDETPQQKWIYLNQILSLGEKIQGEPL